MRIKIHQLPASGSLLLGLFLGVALMMIAVRPLSPESYQDDYGNALAGLTAQRAVEATFNQNLVALHTILGELLEQPNVQVATIHDIENQLLVQAGDNRLADANSIIYTAPIILQDTIAGYVNVTLKKSASNARALWLLLFLFELLLLAVAALVIWQSGAVFIDTNTESNGDENEKSDTDDNSFAAEPPPLVYAVIQIKNVAVLRQQLSSEVYSNTLRRVAKITSDVLALYNGAGCEISERRLVLSFFANDATNEALFRAACSAYLILELASIVNSIPLDLAAFVSADLADLESAENLPIAGLVLEDSAAQDELICRRLSFLDLGSEDGRRVVSDFAQPFKTLLENQHKQLMQLL